MTKVDANITPRSRDQRACPDHDAMTFLRIEKKHFEVIFLLMKTISGSDFWWSANYCSRIFSPLSCKWNLNSPNCFPLVIMQ